MSASTDGRNTFYIGDFDEDMEHSLVIPLTHAIRQQGELRDGRIDLFINSFGGAAHLLDHVIELVEIAKRNDVVVRTIVTSAAYSAGSMLAVAGTPGERYIAKDAAHLVHYGTAAQLGESSPVQAARLHDMNQFLFKRVVDHYNKYCSIPNIEENIVDDYWFINASKAKRWKMADKYMDKFDLLW